MQALAFVLRYRGRKRVDTAAEVTARITAEQLVEHLRVSGFVAMQRPAAANHGLSYRPEGMPSPD
jgi:hypothetical protein